MVSRKMKKQVAPKKPPDINVNTAHAYLPETSPLSVSNTEVSEVDNPGFSADHDEIQLEQRILSALGHHTSQPADAERSVTYSHFTIPVTEPPTLSLTLLRDADVATLIKKDSNSETYALPLPYRRSFGTIGQQWWAGLSPAEARAGPFASNQQVKTAEKVLKDKEKRRIKSLTVKKGIQKTRRADLREALRRQVLHLPMEGFISDTAEQEAMKNYGKEWQEMLQDLDEDDNGLHKIQRAHPSKNNRRRKLDEHGMVKDRNETEGLEIIQTAHTNKNLPVRLRKPDEGTMTEEQYDEDAMVSQDDENAMVENRDDEDAMIETQNDEDAMIEIQDDDIMMENQDDEDAMENQNDEYAKDNQNDDITVESREEDDIESQDNENVMVSQDDEGAIENQDDEGAIVSQDEDDAMMSQCDEDIMMENQEDEDFMLSKRFLVRVVRTATGYVHIISQK